MDNIYKLIKLIEYFSYTFAASNINVKLIVFFVFVLTSTAGYFYVFYNQLPIEEPSFICKHIPVHHNKIDHKTNVIVASISLTTL